MNTQIWSPVGGFNFEAAVYYLPVLGNMINSYNTYHRLFHYIKAQNAINWFFNRDWLGSWNQS